MKAPSDIAKDLRLFAKYHLIRRVYDHPAREEELGVELLGYDPDRYTDQLREAAGDAFEVTILDHVTYRDTRRPIHLVTTNRADAAKTLLVLAGVHGNEQAGLLAIPPLLEALREESLAPDVELRVLTPVNAIGAAEGSRYNAGGFDINRDFVRFETREAQLVKQVFEEHMPDFMVSLHEGPQPATFLFANRLVAPSTAVRLLSRLEGAGVELATVDYFGRTLEPPGYAPMKPATWTLSMIWAATLRMKATGVWADEQGCPEITLESSWTGRDAASRIRAHTELVLGVLDELSTSPKS